MFPKDSRLMDIQSNNHRDSALQGIAGRVQVSTHGCKWVHYPGLSSEAQCNLMSPRKRKGKKWRIKEQGRSVLEANTEKDSTCHSGSGFEGEECRQPLEVENNLRLPGSKALGTTRPWGPQGHGDHRPITAENGFLPTARMRLEANLFQGLQQDHRLASTSMLACETLSENSWVTWPRRPTCRLVRL